MPALRIGVLERRAETRIGAKPSDGAYSAAAEKKDTVDRGENARNQPVRVALTQAPMPRSPLSLRCCSGGADLTHLVPVSETDYRFLRLLRARSVTAWCGFGTVAQAHPKRESR